MSYDIHFVIPLGSSEWARFEINHGSDGEDEAKVEAEAEAEAEDGSDDSDMSDLIE